ncbi:MAG TPA: CBS domain-containing protein [Deltaproteobacteria bacterium]|nr:CBS domain-containing protein [Deltaproteobacteria bacterium]
MVQRFMTPDPILVHDDGPLETAAMLMMRHRFRHLPVISPDGRLVGLLDDAAVFRRGEVRSGRWQVFDPRDDHLLVADVVRPAAIVEPLDAPLIHALRAMVRLGEDAVVVIDTQRRPVGILTAHDAIRGCGSLIAMDTTVAELATQPVVSLTPGQDVGEALQIMRTLGLRHVVVLHGQIPWAVVSWRSLMELDAERRRTTKLSSLERGAVETVTPDTTLAQLVDRMVAQKIGCAPVVDSQQHLVGIISRSDLLKRMVARLRFEGSGA